MKKNESTQEHRRVWAKNTKSWRERKKITETYCIVASKCLRLNRCSFHVLGFNALYFMTYRYCFCAVIYRFSCSFVCIYLSRSLLLIHLNFVSRFWCNDWEWFRLDRFKASIFILYFSQYYYVMRWGIKWICTHWNWRKDSNVNTECLSTWNPN